MKTSGVVKSPKAPSSPKLGSFFCGDCRHVNDTVMANSGERSSSNKATSYPQADSSDVISPAKGEILLSSFRLHICDDAVIDTIVKQAI